MTYQFHWAPTPPVETGAEKRRVAIFALGVGAVFVGSVLAQVVLSLIGSILVSGLARKSVVSAPRFHRLSLRVRYDSRVADPAQDRTRADR